MKKIILSSLAVSALVFACKKDKDNDTVNADQLIGKWEMQSQYRKVVDGGSSKRDTTVMQAGLQTTEFLKNGTVVLSVRTVGGVSRDTGDYKVVGSNIIIEKTDTTKITKLTSTELQGYKKLSTSATKYTEYWFNYKK